MFEWSVYKLEDPRDNRVRYVGFTYNKELRQAAHKRRGLGNGSVEKALWTDELHHAGLEPRFTVIETGVREQEGRAREIYWIEYYLMQGEILFNQIHRGKYLHAPLRCDCCGIAWYGSAYSVRWRDKYKLPESILREIDRGEWKGELPYPKGSYCYVCQEHCEQEKPYAQHYPKVPYDRSVPRWVQQCLENGTMHFGESMYFVLVHGDELQYIRPLYPDEEPQGTCVPYRGWYFPHHSCYGKKQ